MKSEIEENSDTLAAEYVLGVLDAKKDAIAEQLIVQDPSLRQQAAYWAYALAAMRLGQHKSQQAPVWLWSSIQSRMEGGWSKRVPERRKIERSWYALAASIFALALSALLWWSVPTQSPLVLAEQTALLSPEVAGAPVWQVDAMLDLRSVSVKLKEGTTVIATEMPVLWLLTADGIPHLMGELPRNGEARLSVQDGTILSAETNLAISMEPVGVPLGATPRGKVVVVGGWVARN